MARKQSSLKGVGRPLHFEGIVADSAFNSALWQYGWATNWNRQHIISTWEKLHLLPKKRLLARFLQVKVIVARILQVSTFLARFFQAISLLQHTYKNLAINLLFGRISQVTHFLQESYKSLQDSARIMHYI